MPAPGTLTQSAQDGAGPAGRSEGGRPTHWLVPLLYEAAERIRTDADDLKAAHAPDGDWTGEELAKVDHDRDIRLSARLILAAARLERGRAMKVTCERCMYWDNSHEEERAQGRSGFCRQSPPHPEWHWALTDPHHWCGQAMPNVHQGTGTWTWTITTKTVVVAEVGGTGGGDAPSPPPQRQSFAPPTAQQVMDYADGLGYDGFDAEAFCDHYASVGWTVGRSPMKDWHAAVRQWRRRETPPF